MKHCDPNWNITCIETALHILCFNNLRKDTVNVYQLKTDKIHKIAKHIKGTTDRITKFFEKTKILDRKPQSSKRNLSPNRIIKQGRNKRKNGRNLSMNAKKDAIHILNILINSNLNTLPNMKMIICTTH